MLRGAMSQVILVVLVLNACWIGKMPVEGYSTVFIGGLMVVACSSIDTDTRTTTCSVRERRFLVELQLLLSSLTTWIQIVECLITKYSFGGKNLFALHRSPRCHNLSYVYYMSIKAATAYSFFSIASIAKFTTLYSCSGVPCCNRKPYWNFGMW